MVAERLAVVGHREDDERPVAHARAHAVEQPPDLLVHERDFAGVARAPLPARRGALEPAGEERLGRLVRKVRVEVVRPEEERRRQRLRLEQAQAVVGHLRGGPLVLSEVGALAGLRRIEVDVEALLEPEHRVEREGGDDGAGRPAGGPEALREREGVVAEPEGRVVAHARLERPASGEERGVRRQRHRRRRARLREADALGRQRVQARRGVVSRRAVAMERVGARRVERDQEHARRVRRRLRDDRPVRRRTRARLLTFAGRGDQEQRGGDDAAPHRLSAPPACGRRRASSRPASPPPRRSRRARARSRRR